MSQMGHFSSVFHALPVQKICKRHSAWTINGFHGDLTGRTQPYSQLSVPASSWLSEAAHARSIGMLHLHPGIMFDFFWKSLAHYDPDLIESAAP